MTSPRDGSVTELLAAALAARANAHVPYSSFQVGAAIRGGDGRIYAGANVENVAYPQSQCAEATAIGTMVTAGCREIAEIVIVAGGAALIAPCGGCRQRLIEFAGADVRVHLADPDGIRHSTTLGALMPLAFGRDHLA
ncbi:MAG TPA: cytidine deaminase [Stellaceae bacterium]|nr:cytidine deaminase [Stellaceae bacterium]